MIANVDQTWSLRQSAAKLPAKENEFVEVSHPFGNEATGELQPAEQRWRLDDFSLNTGGGQTIQHHGREPLHTLLAIQGVVTYQQNHQDDAERPSHATARRNVTDGQCASVPRCRRWAPEAGQRYFPPPGTARSEKPRNRDLWAGRIAQ